MTRCEEFLSNLKINSKSTSIFKIFTTIHVSNEKGKNAENVQKDSSNLQDIRNVDLYVEFYGEKNSSYIYVYCV